MTSRRGATSSIEVSTGSVSQAVYSTISASQPYSINRSRTYSAVRRAPSVPAVCGREASASRWARIRSGWMPARTRCSNAACRADPSGEKPRSDGAGTGAAHADGVAAATIASAHATRAGAQACRKARAKKGGAAGRLLPVGAARVGFSCRSVFVGFQLPRPQPSAEAMGPPAARPQPFLALGAVAAMLGRGGTPGTPARVANVEGLLRRVETLRHRSCSSEQLAAPAGAAPRFPGSPGRQDRVLARSGKESTPIVPGGTRARQSPRRCRRDPGRSEPRGAEHRAAGPGASRAGPKNPAGAQPVAPQGCSRSS